MELSMIVKNSYTLKMLNEEGIKTTFDCLNNIPIKYINYKPITRDGFYEEKVLVKALITNEPVFKKHKENLNSITFQVVIFNSVINVMIFNRAFLLKKLKVNEYIYIYGKYEYYKKTFLADNIFFKEIDEIEVIYSQKRINKNYKYIINTILNDYNHEILPKYILDKYKLIDEATMYRYCHMPNNINEVKEFYRRMKYQELFLFELMLEYKKYNKKKVYKEPKKYDIVRVKNFINKLPFELTPDQKTTVNEIFIDLKSDYPANRLIQGDVGSGKTIVSALSILASITAGYQAALMAPTEILAIQHYNSLTRLFDGEIKIEVLTSSIKGKKRKEILDRLINNDIDLLIGTHALITDDVLFHKLGIVVADEQHRFGVAQRLALANKGVNPDVLYLSATPIPRTLAISLFGDMDLSIIRTKPEGRKEVVTRYLSLEDEKIAIDLLKRELEKNHQAYIITPLIEDTKETNLFDVFKVYEKISNMLDYRVGILHGKMKPKEKDEVMEKFKNHEIDILVSTTVIEVGVDVYNATFILIYDGERFGLSQLHQLRGRVGRNSYDNTCVILSRSKDKERLKIIESTYDGFKLAEEDLRMRGPGDFFGVKQSGIPTFKVANLVDDFRILEYAKKDAYDIINNKLYHKDCEELLNYLKFKQSNIE